MRILIVAGLALALSACQTENQPVRTGATSGSTSQTILSDGVLVSYRHVDAEPTRYILESTDTAPALRIRGVQGADGVRAATRAMGLICGIDQSQAEDYGAFGDPLWYDTAAAEWVFWLDCREH